MIRNFRHKGLERLFVEGSTKGVSAQHVTRLKRILLALHRSRGPEGMSLPGFRLHPLKGERRGQWRFQFPAIGELFSDLLVKMRSMSIWWIIIE